MKIIELSRQEYFRTFPSPQHAYNSAAFIALNSPKASEVRHLCIADSKPRLGLTVGIGHDGSLRAPFSAPFSGFDFNRRQSAEVMIEAARLLRAELQGLSLTLPPAPYSPDMNFRTQAAFIAAGAKLNVDWNFHIPLAGTDYSSLLLSPAKNKLRQALASPFALLKINEEPLRAYEIIHRNRSQRGYPLRMSADDVINTTQGTNAPIKADFFVLTDGQTDIASAMVYRPTPNIAQVIYWGNDQEATGCDAPMNLLACQLASHYQTQGMEILDIGPSSSDGIPSAGLCDFKDSIGCIMTPKPTLYI